MFGQSFRIKNWYLQLDLNFRLMFFFLVLLLNFMLLPLHSHKNKFPLKIYFMNLTSSDAYAAMWFPFQIGIKLWQLFFFDKEQNMDESMNKMKRNRWRQLIFNNHSMSESRLRIYQSAWDDWVSKFALKLKSRRWDEWLCQFFLESKVLPWTPTDSKSKPYSMKSCEIVTHQCRSKARHWIYV